MITHKNILSAKYYDDPFSRQLIDKISSILDSEMDEVTIYYDYTLSGSFDELIDNPKILVISKLKGVFIFDISENQTGRNNDIYKELELVFRKEEILFANFLKNGNSSVKNRRNINFSLQSFLYAPQLSDDIVEEGIIKKDSELLELFQQDSEFMTDDMLEGIYSVIGYSGGLYKPRKRIIEDGEENTKGSLLNELEKEIALFDNEQQYAALSDLNGPQRIRGLAGSGKTVILCMKAAALHLRYPNKKIMYTFMTKSLYDYIELLITRFYKLMGDGSLPDFENSIMIRHSWGGRNIAGVYFEACQQNNVVPLTLAQARQHSNGQDVFEFVCEDLLKKTKGKINSAYDYVLIDEAQDFRPSFYQICRGLTTTDNLVWGYDNLQNIYDVEIQDTMKTFSNEFGNLGIDLKELRKNHPEMNNDIVLPKSYRNAKEILITAHSLGFGIYNNQLIQMFENNQHWEDLGYQVESGESKIGDRMVISRPISNSPLSISQRQNFDDLIEIYSAKGMQDEIDWVSSEIEEAILIQKLRPEDIVVISLDDRYAKSYLSKIETKLFGRGINSYNLSDDYYSKGFIKENAVTLSTVYKAKGNEAGLVFVIGCDVFEKEKDSIKMRNRIFTAFTRSKGWLKISGINIEDDQLVSEIDRVKSNNLKLIFEYQEAKIIKRYREDYNKSHLQIEKLAQELSKLNVTAEEYQELINKYE